MAGELPDQPGSGGPPGEPAREVQPPGEAERLGAVAIARHLKGDGRALILYSRLEEGERT